jgi:trk system potassium uptake protein TrkA
MSRPVDVSDTEVLYCPTNQDQTHVIASLVGRSLGFRRVVPKIDDPELEQIRDEVVLITYGDNLDHLTERFRSRR